MLTVQSVLFALWLQLARARDNGLGTTPGMGFDLDYGSPVAPGPGRGNASYVMGIADFFMTPSPHSWPPNKTPRELGYWMIETDSCWDTDARNATTGELVVDRTKYPDGLEPVVAYLDARNITFGLYGDRGNKDCNGNPGQLGHEVQDANFLAKHGIGWFKVDSCSAPGDRASAFKEYMIIGDALQAAAAANGTRQIYFAMCGWQPWYAPPDPSNNYPGGIAVGNAWRVGPDTGSGWSAVLINVGNALNVSRYAGRGENGGGWNDGSLLLNPGMGCPGTACANSQQCGGGQKCVDGQCTGGKANPKTCMTESRSRSMFSLWCVLALNLVMTGNLPLIAQRQPVVLQNWLNSEAIAVDQDPTWNGTAGLFARRLDASPLTGNGLQPGHTSECGGEPAGQSWTFGVPADGYLRNNGTALCLSVADCGTEIAYDSCETDPKRVTCAGKGLYPHFQWSLDTERHLLLSKVRPNTCAAVTSSSGDMTAVTCDASDPRQQWAYNTATQQLTNQGHCLTADDPTPPPGPAGSSSIIGRPIRGGAWAIVMLNDTPEDAVVACNSACTALMGFHASTKLAVRDIINHKDLSPVTAADGVSASIPANGSSVFLTLTPVQQ